MLLKRRVFSKTKISFYNFIVNTINPSWFSLKKKKKTTNQFHKSGNFFENFYWIKLLKYFSNELCFSLSFFPFGKIILKIFIFRMLAIPLYLGFLVAFLIGTIAIYLTLVKIELI
jgi:hypothetical protein